MNRFFKGVRNPFHRDRWLKRFPRRAMEGDVSTGMDA